MNITKIVSALIETLWSDCAAQIIPPWIEGWNEEEAEIKEAWNTVRSLRTQRDELIVIFPHKKEEFNQQFNAELLKQARSVHESLFTLTP